MKMSKERYCALVEARSPKSPIGKNLFRAFWVGGLICAIGQILTDLYSRIPFSDPKIPPLLCSVSLIFAADLLTALGIFDNIARFAGAGTLVPITGFANAVVSPAIDSRAEGFLLGVGAKIFTVAGPVLLWGTLAGALYGVILWIVGLF